MNFPNYIIPDPNDCMPQRLRLWLLFPSLLQNSALCTRSSSFAAGEHPAICYLTPHPFQVCLQLPPPDISLHACKVFGLLSRLLCSAARVGRDERGDCPAHCPEEQGSLGHALNKWFGWSVFSHIAAVLYESMAMGWVRSLLRSYAKIINRYWKHLKKALDLHDLSKGK